MSDGIKFIFKTLIKIPLIIAITFAIFNLFAFGLSYMKILGLSFVAKQVAMENNYIPAAESLILREYMDNYLETELLPVVKFTDDTQFTRQQYGSAVKVGVEAKYKVVLPLMPKEQIHGSFAGYDGTGFHGFKTQAEIDAFKAERDSRIKSNIRIEYLVPGLKYYPDMEL